MATRGRHRGSGPDGRHRLRGGRGDRRPRAGGALRRRGRPGRPRWCRCGRRSPSRRPRPPTSGALALGADVVVGTTGWTSGRLRRSRRTSQGFRPGVLIAPNRDRRDPHDGVRARRRLPSTSRSRSSSRTIRTRSTHHRARRPARQHSSRQPAPKPAYQRCRTRPPTTDGAAVRAWTAYDARSAPASWSPTKGPLRRGGRDAHHPPRLLLTGSPSCRGPHRGAAHRRPPRRHRGAGATSRALWALDSGVTPSPPATPATTAAARDDDDEVGAQEPSTIATTSRHLASMTSEPPEPTRSAARRPASRATGKVVIRLVPPAGGFPARSSRRKNFQRETGDTGQQHGDPHRHAAAAPVDQMPVAVAGRAIRPIKR